MAEEKNMIIIEGIRKILVNFNSKNPLEQFLKDKLKEKKYRFTITYSDRSPIIFGYDSKSDTQIWKNYLDKIISGHSKTTKPVFAKNLVSTSEILEVNKLDDILINNNLEDVFYSAYKNLNIEDFKKKYIIWFTPQLNQSLPHIFNSENNITTRMKEGDLIQPKIFRFKLKKSIKLIKSNTVNNEYIFLNILNDRLIAELLEFLNSKNIKNFTETDNLYILLILDEFNKLVSDEYKIYGYKNYYDQNEIAITNFSNLVDETSIKESDYKSFSIVQSVFGQDEIVTYNFPIGKTQIYEILGLDARVKYADGLNKDKELLKRMIIDDKRIKISYNDFDTGKPVEWTPPDINEFYKLKYLKYKQKYINLKKVHF
jgi:hypothetical protein